MIDIHCHLLPNVDDGPKSWEESLEMIRIAAGDGIKGAVTTPHWIQGTNWQPRPEKVREVVAELNSRIGKAGLDFEVFPGMEIGIIPDLPRYVSKGDVLSLADSHFVLIEIPFYSLPLGIEEVIYGLRSIEKTPVLAHPERNREYQGAPKRILELVGMGALVQVTASSLTGGFGDDAKSCSIEFAKLGALHFISSDAHSNKHRPPLVSKGLAVVEKKIGRDAADEIVSNTYKIISGKASVRV
jgi:protein-tyrosine phosphatase